MCNNDEAALYEAGIASERPLLAAVNRRFHAWRLDMISDAINRGALCDKSASESEGVAANRNKCAMAPMSERSAQRHQLLR